MTKRPLIFVVTAGMGAGHDQVGRELSRRLDSFDVGTRLVDAGEILPRGWGRAMTAFYKFMACRAQWLYEVTFRLTMCPQPGARPVVLPVSRPAEKRLAALIAEERPALVLSTFHLCSQVAGRMRAAGSLDVPVASFLLDFFVHGMWAHPGVDAHLLLHPSQRPQLEARGGRRPVVCGPVVRPEFTPAGRRWGADEARRSVGLEPGERCALIVAGSWGAGALPQTVDAVQGAGRFVPVVLTGHNHRLRQALLARYPEPRASPRGPGRVKVLGWVDEIDRLVAAADVVVENAGGLTAMEAMALGVPVVSYAPIAGHGRQNAENMHQARVSRYARSAAQLAFYLDALSNGSPLRRRVVSEAASMFKSDAAAILARWAKAGRVDSAVSLGCLQRPSAGAPLRTNV